MQVSHVLWRANFLSPITRRQLAAHHSDVADFSEKGCNNNLTFSSLNLPLSSSSTTSRELLPQFSTCSGWRWLAVVIKNTENYHALVNQFPRNFRSRTLSCRKIRYVFSDVKWCFNASWGLKGLNSDQYVIVMRLVWDWSGSVAVRWQSSCRQTIATEGA